MTRFAPLFTLLIALSACDTVAEPQTAEISTGATYSGTTLELVDAETGALHYDFLDRGAQIAVEFETHDRFVASLFVPEAALVESGETEDVDGDVRQRVVGTYVQSEGELTFTQSVDTEPPVDTFFDSEGWHIAADGSSIRYSDTDGEVAIHVVLTRQ